MRILYIQYQPDLLRHHHFRSRQTFWHFVRAEGEQSLCGSFFQCRVKSRFSVSTLCKALKQSFISEYTCLSLSSGQSWLEKVILPLGSVFWGVFLWCIFPSFFSEFVWSIFQNVEYLLNVEYFSRFFNQTEVRTFFLFFF